MNTTQDDGGPAFPVPTLEREYWDREQGEPNGMSLRDWFAGMALQGLLSNNETSYTPAENAKEAYSFAAAMLAAREHVAENP